MLIPVPVSSWNRCHSFSTLVPCFPLHHCLSGLCFLFILPILLHCPLAGPCCLCFIRATLICFPPSYHFHSQKVAPPFLYVPYFGAIRTARPRTPALPLTLTTVEPFHRSPHNAFPTNFFFFPSTSPSPQTEAFRSRVFRSQSLVCMYACSPVAVWG